MIFASNNVGKLNNIREILNMYEIKSLKDVKIEVEIAEDQDSFYENALKKEKEPVISDDSGICSKY